MAGELNAETGGSGHLLAAGLTPAWQHMLVFDHLRLGEVNRAGETYACASGKVTNVGLALHFLGGPNRTALVLGGTPGRCIRDEFDALGLNYCHVETRNSTRECTTVIDEQHQRTTELVQNAPQIADEEIDQYLKLYESEAKNARFVVMSGSLPPQTDRRFYRWLLERTPPGTPVILDARGEELLETLAAKPFLVKPNREELGMTFGRSLDSDDDVEAAIGELHARGAENVLVSDGAEALWLSAAGQLHRLLPLTVETVNPIGCGDCLAAGTAWAIAADMDLVDAVRFGITAAAENAAAMLPSRLSAARIRQRMDEVGLLA